MPRSQQGSEECAAGTAVGCLERPVCAAQQHVSIPSPRVGRRPDAVEAVGHGGRSHERGGRGSAAGQSGAQRLKPAGGRVGDADGGEERGGGGGVLKHFAVLQCRREAGICARADEDDKL